MTPRLPKLLFACLAFLLWTSSGEAQSWQSGSTARQFRGEDHLDVKVTFAAGTLELRRGRVGELFRSSVHYDADLFEWDTQFQAEESRLVLDLTPHEPPDDFELSDDYPQRLDLALSPAVPLRLDLEFGMARGDLDLGGLSVESAQIKTGASESAVRFSEPNRVTCQRLEIAVGAAQLHVVQLGNARCTVMEVAGGAGELTLDFTGTWADGFDARAEVTVGLGTLTLRLPERLGISIEVSRFLASFEERGFVKRGSRFVSPGYDEAPSRLDVTIRAVLGDVNVEWVPSGN